MKLTNAQIKCFDDKCLKLPTDYRTEIHRQVHFLIERLESKIKEDTSFKVKRFKKTGSLAKGTVLKPRDEVGVDADVAVYLDLSESDKDDIDLLHQIILDLMRSVYPQKQDEDFSVQPRTLGIHFRDSELDVDLVPIVPISSEPGFGWQPSSQGEKPIKTSVDGQLAFIKKRRDDDSLYRILVRLSKKWRNNTGLESLRSFVIELVLAHIQDTQGAAPTLERGVQRFFLYVAQSKLLTPINPSGLKPTIKHPGPAVILDPVNPDNNVALRLTDSERKEIVTAAETAWELISTASRLAGKGETVEMWKEVFGRSFVIEE